MDEFSMELLELEGVADSLKDIDSYYEYNGSLVPRVTNIISHCEDNRALIDWAASMGYKRYKDIKASALEIGTVVHEFVDEYLVAKYNMKMPYEVDYTRVQTPYRSKVYNSFENFKLWESNLESLGYKIEEVVGLEIPVVTPWYGGTIDAIFKINGVYYIIDFKTSKKIFNNYLIQTAAYYWAVNNGYCPTVQGKTMGGVGIIRLDKANYGVINDLFLNNSNPDQFNLINNLISCFWSYLVAYYRTMSVNYQDDMYKKGYNLRSVI